MLAFASRMPVPTEDDLLLSSRGSTGCLSTFRRAVAAVLASTLVVGAGAGLGATALASLGRPLAVAADQGNGGGDHGDGGQKADRRAHGVGGETGEHSGRHGSGDARSGEHSSAPAAAPVSPHGVAVSVPSRPVGDDRGGDHGAVPIDGSASLPPATGQAGQPSSTAPSSAGPVPALGVVVHAAPIQLTLGLGPPGGLGGEASGAGLVRSGLGGVLGVARVRAALIAGGIPAALLPVPSPRTAATTAPVVPQSVNLPSSTTPGSGRGSSFGASAASSASGAVGGGAASLPPRVRSTSSGPGTAVGAGGGTTAAPGSAPTSASQAPAGSPGTPATAPSTPPSNPSPLPPPLLLAPAPARTAPGVAGDTTAALLPAAAVVLACLAIGFLGARALMRRT